MGSRISYRNCRCKELLRADLQRQKRGISRWVKAGGTHRGARTKRTVRANPICAYFVPDCYFFMDDAVRIRNNVLVISQ